MNLAQRRKSREVNAAVGKEVSKHKAISWGAEIREVQEEYLLQSLATGRVTKQSFRQHPTVGQPEKPHVRTRMKTVDIDRTAVA